MTPPIPKCWRCRVVLDGRQPKFCPECGADLALDPSRAQNVPASIQKQPVIEQDRPVHPAEASWPPPPAELKLVDRTPGSNDLPRLRSQVGSPLSRPLTPRDRQPVPPRPHVGFTDTLSVFKNSGPLGKSVEAMLDEYKQRSQPQPATSGAQRPPAKPPTAVGAPTPPPERPRFETGELRDLPPWLQNAARTPAPVGPEAPWQVAAPKPSSGAKDESWLISSKHSVPLLPENSSPLYKSDPTMKVPRVPKPAPAKQEPYPPLPDGTVPCTRCGGAGIIYPHMGKCPAGCHNGRVPAQPIPQPMPDFADAITGKDVTSDERAMLAQLQADVTGPTALALEAVKSQPQPTDPIPEVQAAERDRQANAQDSVANILSWLEKVGMQSEFMADTLRGLAEHAWHGDEFIFKTSSNCVRQIGDLVELAVTHLTGWQETEEARRGKR